MIVQAAVLQGTLVESGGLSAVVSMAVGGNYDVGYDKGIKDGKAEAKAEYEASNALILTDINEALEAKGAETAENMADVPQKIDGITVGSTLTVTHDGNGNVFLGGVTATADGNGNVQLN